MDGIAVKAEETYGTTERIPKTLKVGQDALWVNTGLLADVAGSRAQAAPATFWTPKPDCARNATAGAMPRAAIRPRSSRPRTCR